MNVILFDIDGTLIRSGGAGLDAILQTLHEEFGVDDPKPVALHGCTDRGITRELFELNGIERDEDSWQRFLAAYLRNLQTQLSAKEGAILPGVVPLLDELAEREHVYLGLLTGNVRRGASLKLEHFELEHYFGEGGFGDHHEDRNDVARAAREAVERELGEDLNEDRLWIIGDTPNDVRCGRAINAKVLAVCTGGSDRVELEASGPDFLVDDLTCCDAWLDQVVGNSA